MSCGAVACTQVRSVPGCGCCCCSVLTAQSLTGISESSAACDFVVLCDMCVCVTGACVRE